MRTGTDMFDDESSFDSSSHESSHNHSEQHSITEVDMGYEDHAPSAHYQQTSSSSSNTCSPQRRRNSMTTSEQCERRASIKAIMADDTLAPREKRQSIQFLMDGRRMSATGGGNTTASSSDSSSADDQHQQQPPTLEALTIIAKSSTTTTAQHSQQSWSICNEQTKRAETTRPPCNHYQRNCTIIANCCQAAFGCRICHDDCPVLPRIKEDRINNGMRPKFHRSASLGAGGFDQANDIMASKDSTSHTIDRFAIAEVICRECYTRQSSKQNNCIKCGIEFGEYHCNICNLWMAAEERPYHCEFCGFCRVGGAENFQHCNDCGMCIDVNLYENHHCSRSKYESNCPVCQEYLFSSRSASHEMPCGHAIHWDCFQELSQHDSRCPICKKTAETRERMQPTWDNLAYNIAAQPVPPELCRVVNITCNDCEVSRDGLGWHFLGVQCPDCESFNTTVERIVLQGADAHDFLHAQQVREMAADHHNNNNGDGEAGGAGLYEQQPATTTRPIRRRMNRRQSAF